MANRHGNAQIHIKMRKFRSYLFNPTWRPPLSHQTKTSPNLLTQISQPNSEGSTAAPTTIKCSLKGGYPATAATCTGRSAISGLGEAASTSTLKNSQLDYALVAITEGYDKIKALPRHTGSPPDKDESTGAAGAAGAEATFAPQWVIGGLAAAVGFLVP